VPESKRNEFTVPPGPSIRERTEAALLDTMKRCLAATETHEILLLRGECQGIAKMLAIYMTPFVTYQQLLREFKAKAEGQWVEPVVPRLQSRRYNVDVQVGR